MALPNLLNETFEGTGYTAMTGAELVDAGCTLDEDYATSNAGSPSGWGSQCLRAISTGATTQARKNHTFGTALTGNLYFRDEFYLVSESIPNAGSSIIFTAWDTGFVKNLFHIYLKRDTPDFKIVVEFTNGGTPIVVNTFGLATATRYTVDVNYNISSATYAVQVNGTTSGSGNLTGGAALPADCQLVYVGSDVLNGAGPAIQILHDNVGIGNQGFIGQSGGATLTGTALAGVTETDIRAGGKTIIITLTNDTWIP